MELGVLTFGDILPDPVTGAERSAQQKMKETLELAKLADELGLDVFGVGEHHRLDMVLSAPPVVLAAAAAVTKQIKLTSGTTVLNTLDPVRVFEDFATVDLLSGGRAEIIAGRGSFTENFNLFGHNMQLYDELFAENLGLLMQLNREAVVNWEGRYRPALEDAEVAPRPTKPIPIWLGMGGTPQSAARAGQLGLPLNIAILGSPEQFIPYVDLYRRSYRAAGHPEPGMRFAVSSHGLIGDDDAATKQTMWEYYSRQMAKGLRNRFPPRQIPRPAYDFETSVRGGIFAGDPKAIIEKIKQQRKTLGLDRLILQFDFGGVPWSLTKRSVELLGTEVLPEVRKLWPKA